MNNIMNNKKITTRQQELLTFITEYQEACEVLPTLATMARVMNITVGAVSNKIEALIKKGVLERRSLYTITY